MKHLKSTVRPHERWWGGPLLAVGLSLVGCSKEQEHQAAPEVTVNIVTAKAEQTTIASEFPGRTRAFEVSPVRPQVGGIIKRRLFEEGSKVVAGQALYEIESAPFAAEFQRASAQVLQARATASAAKVKAERYSTLRYKEAVSQQDAEDARLAADQAAATYASAQAALKTAQINLDYATIRAPIAGMISASSVTAGTLVSQGQSDALATITRLDPIYVDVSQSSGELLALRRQLAEGGVRQVQGKPVVELTLEDGTTYPEQGTLEVRGVMVNESNGAVALRAIVPNPSAFLLPGMYVKANISLAVDERAILLPQQAVGRDPKGQPVAMVVNAQNVIEQRALKVTRSIGNRWLVSSGINEGDRVVIEGIGAQPGAKVKTVDYKAPAQASPATAQRTATQTLTVSAVSVDKTKRD